MFFLSNFRLWHKKLLCIHLDTFLHKQALYKALTYLYQGRHMRFPENQNLTQIFRNANINKAKIALYRVFCTSRRLRYPPTLGCSSQLTSLFPVSILSAASMHNCLWNCSAKAIKTVSWLSAELFGSLTYFTEQYHLFVSTQPPKTMGKPGPGTQHCPPASPRALPHHVLGEAFVHLHRKFYLS